MLAEGCQRTNQLMASYLGQSGRQASES